MSTGEFCLRCRFYVNAPDKYWQCQCENPLLKRPEQHPVDKAFDKVFKELEDEEDAGLF